MQKGKIHIYTGNGKGKTTAAVGLAIRAAGRGKSVEIIQFMKGQEYGEHLSLKKIPGIHIQFFGSPECITKEEVDTSHIDMAKKAMHYVREVFTKNKTDIIILDEIIVSVWFGLIPESEVIDLLKGKPLATELVLTGRYASKKLMAEADLVTEMTEIKHYYKQGTSARKGIEY